MNPNEYHAQPKKTKMRYAPMPDGDADAEHRHPEPPTELVHCALLSDVRRRYAVAMPCAVRIRAFSASNSAVGQHRGRAGRPGPGARLRRGRVGRDELAARLVDHHPSSLVAPAGRRSGRSACRRRARGSRRRARAPSRSRRCHRAGRCRSARSPTSSRGAGRSGGEEVLPERIRYHHGSLLEVSGCATSSPCGRGGSSPR